MINTIGAVRWIVHSDERPAHVVYEHDDGYTRTMCGLYLHGGRGAKVSRVLADGARAE